MNGLPNDTHPDIEKILIEGYRKMSPAEKFRRVCEMNDFARRLALADIRHRHPLADDRECQLRLASRFLNPELMKKAFGWDPEEKGY
jgi:hypothetical protein